MESAVASKTISNKTINGIGWSLASKFSRQFLQLFFQVALARLLLPEDFGFFGMTIVFINLAEILRTMGFASAIIQRKEVNDRFLNTAFLVNLGISLVLFGVFQITAPFISQFYRSPAVTPILRGYSFIFLISSMNMVQEALLHKNLQFKRLFLMDTVAVMIAGIAAVVIALQGGGVYTLVAQYLILNIVSTIILWITSSWRPRIQFDREAFAELKKYGFSLLANDLLVLLSRNIDNLLIGRYLGAAALGIYSRAYFFMLQPLNLTNQVLARVMFPVLSRYQNDFEKIRSIYLLSTRLLAFVVFPLFAYIFVTAETLIVLLLGENWRETAYLLKIFCLYSLIDTLGLTTNWIYKATGHTRKLFRWTTFSTLVLVTAIIIGLNWGIRGVAWSYSISFVVLLWIPGWMICFRIIQLQIKDMLFNIAAPFFSGLVTMAILYITYQQFSAISHPVILCLFLFVECMCCYLLICFLASRSVVLEFNKRVLGYFFKHLKLKVI